MDEAIRTARCDCGQVALEAREAPIVAVTCRCSGCREAGRLLQGLPGAPAILDADGGTPFVLYRKDRVACVRGREFLAQHRLTDATPTRRVVATCCNSFMFLDFTKGHWITLVRGRFADGLAFEGVREERRQSVSLFARLMIAWARMGFRTPVVDYVERDLRIG